MPKTTKPTESQDTIIEGLQGRLPFLVGGILFFFANTIGLQIRAATNRNANVINGDQLPLIIAVWLVIVFIIAPLAHTFSHALAIKMAGKSLRWTRKWWYPRVRPVEAVSKAEARKILLAPLILSGILLILLIVPVVSAFAAVWNGVNIGLLVNDVWKVMGLMRFSNKQRFSMEIDHLRVES